MSTKTQFDPVKFHMRIAQNYAEGHGSRLLIGWAKETRAEWGFPPVPLVECLSSRAAYLFTLPINHHRDGLYAPLETDIEEAIRRGLSLMGIDPLQDTLTVHESIGVSVSTSGRHQEAYPKGLWLSALRRIVRVLDPIEPTGSIQLSFPADGGWLSIEFGLHGNERFASVLYQHHDWPSWSHIRVDFFPLPAEQGRVRGVYPIPGGIRDIPAGGVEGSHVRHEEGRVPSAFVQPRGAAVPRPPEQAEEGGSDAHQGGDGLQVHGVNADGPSSPGNGNSAV